MSPLGPLQEHTATDPAGGALVVPGRRCPKPDCHEVLLYMKMITPPGSSMPGLVGVEKGEDLEALLYEKTLHEACSCCDHSARVTSLDLVLLLVEFAKLPVTRPTRLVLYRKYRGRAPFVVHTQYWSDEEGWANSNGFYNEHYAPSFAEFQRRLVHLLESFSHEEVVGRVEEGIHRRERAKPA